MAGLQWNGWERSRVVNRERMVLERIVALLLALAGLADRAAGASSRRRLQVAGFLSLALAEVQAMIVRLAGLQPLPAHVAESLPAITVAGSVDEIRRLAAALRVLALALHALLEQTRRIGHPIFKAWLKASCGISTLPGRRMPSSPSFCFSSSLRVRVRLPP